MKTNNTSKIQLIAFIGQLDMILTKERKEHIKQIKDLTKEKNNVR